MKDNKPKTCFVICPIGDVGSESRRRSDQVLKHIILPIVKSFGYKAVRSDKISESGMITSQIIQHLIEDELVIADLTGANPNVYYELAPRHMLNKPVVLLAQTREDIYFDISSQRTIFFNYSDLDSVEECKKKLTEHIQNIEKDPTKADSPFSIAIATKELLRSDSPVADSIVQIKTMVENLVASRDEINVAIVNIDTLWKKVFTDQFERNMKRHPEGTRWSSR